jgi:hypothetical protein
MKIKLLNNMVWLFEWFQTKVVDILFVIWFFLLIFSK